MRLAYAPYRLIFREPSGTSRGVMHHKDTCIIKIWDENNPEVFGIGEAAVFKGLSPEYGYKFGLKLIELLANVAIGKATDLSGYSSILYGFEQAIRDYASGGRNIYYESDFLKGKQCIPINGLIWMGDQQVMQKRIDQKLEQGYDCIKIKVGAIEWTSEIKLIENLRQRYSTDTLQIRVDANGAFTMEQAIPRLDRLARLGVHSIEQPIQARQPELMAFLCSISPLPIALDEELIGIEGELAKASLLDTIRPAYIILKPALCGGFSGAEEWIRLASERNIGWWITSALESNVGLNALAQWTATFNPKIHQGLGTGQLFTNNFTSPLFLNIDELNYHTEFSRKQEEFTRLDWHS